MTTREGWWLLREMLAYLPRAEGFCGCPTQDTQTRVRFCIPQLGTTALLGVLQPLFFFFFLFRENGPHPGCGKASF